MLTPEEHERIRRAYYVDKKSLRQIAREARRNRETVQKAVSDGPLKVYHLKEERAAPIFGPFQEEQQRLEEKTATGSLAVLRPSDGERTRGGSAFSKVSQEGSLCLTESASKSATIVW